VNATTRRLAVTFGVAIAVAACGSDFTLFDPSAPVLEARFVADSAGTGRLPLTWYDTLNAGIKLVADTLIFAPDGQVTRRWSAYFLIQSAGHWDSTFATTAWNGQYDVAATGVRTWFAMGIPVALPESLAWVGDTVLIKQDDFVVHARLRYRRVPAP
jgi:hypothetical protein